MHVQTLQNYVLICDLIIFRYEFHVAGDKIKLYLRPIWSMCIIAFINLICNCAWCTLLHCRKNKAIWRGIVGLPPHDANGSRGQAQWPANIREGSLMLLFFDYFIYYASMYTVNLKTPSVLFGGVQCVGKKFSIQVYVSWTFTYDVIQLNNCVHLCHCVKWVWNKYNQFILWIMSRSWRGIVKHFA